jgi:predicted RNase H-like nuclease (RuvC/YqgF family)
MTQATDTDNRDLTNLITNLDKKLDKLDSKIETNTKAIGDLKDSISSLREETRVGLIRLDGDVRELRAEIGSLDAKFDERTKVGFWGFILRGTVLALIIGVGGYLLPVIAEYVHKLPAL